MVKKIKIALYDSDGFMEALVNYLCRKKQNLLEARLFTNLELLQKAVQSGQIDVLLAAEEVVEDCVALKKYVSEIILLSEGNRFMEYSEFPVIFKFQPVTEIVREIFELIAEDEHILYRGKMIAKKTAEVIACYSPYGGAGVTNYARKLALEFAERNHSLYVNLEQFHGFSEVSQKSKEKQREMYRGMSEVIFYLKQKKSKLALKLESIIFPEEKLDSIFAVEDFEDLYHMTAEDMMHFLKILINETEYEKIVFDIGYLGEASLFLMEQCDKLWIPTAKDDMQKTKEQAFFHMLQRKGKDNLCDKIVRFT